ncbi:MAG: DUF485 domain-containing protein [Dechloromonas sp.]|nr:MAG: DUF485 domain-containing protein [Dechloromonas sp.]
MQSNIYERIRENPKYLLLKRTRRRFAWGLTLLVLGVYLAYLALVAFAADWLETPVAGMAATTIGIPLGIGVIVFTIAVTAVYVRRANREFDALKDDIIRELRK